MASTLLAVLALGAAPRLSSALKAPDPVQVPEFVKKVAVRGTSDTDNPFVLFEQKFIDTYDPFAAAGNSVAVRLPDNMPSQVWAGDEVKAARAVGISNGPHKMGAFAAGGASKDRAHAVYGAALELKAAPVESVIGSMKAEPSHFDGVVAVPSKAGGTDWARLKVDVDEKHLEADEAKQLFAR